VPSNGAPVQVMDVRTSTANQTNQYDSYEGLWCLYRLEQIKESVNRCSIDISELTNGKCIVGGLEQPEQTP